MMKTRRNEKAARFTRIPDRRVACPVRRARGAAGRDSSNAAFPGKTEGDFPPLSKDFDGQITRSEVIFGGGPAFPTRAAIIIGRGSYERNRCPNIQERNILVKSGDCVQTAQLGISVLFCPKKVRPAFGNCRIDSRCHHRHVAARNLVSFGRRRRGQSGVHAERAARPDLFVAYSRIQ